MDRVLIAGVGMTQFGRQIRRSEANMAETVAEQALKDAGISEADVQRVFVANAAAGLESGQEMILDQVPLQTTSLAGIPLVNVENACASGSSAVSLAYEAILAGRCDIAMVIGVEKLSHDDKTRGFQALRGATGVDCTPVSVADAQAVNSVIIDVYAVEARRYMADYGATLADLAEVAVKNRRHASMNPLAQHRQQQDVDAVLANRTVVDPLTLPMCAPTTDGAAALVLCSDRFAHRLGTAACHIRATRLVSGSGAGSQPVADAATAAFDDAQLGPGDLDLVELHDAAAPAEIRQYEEIGLCGPGEGHLLLRSGATALGGRLPVNVSGGLMSRGHPIAATGCAQLVEIYDQLAGRAGSRQVDGARVGMAMNAGGWLDGSYASCVATVMEKAG